MAACGLLVRHAASFAGMCQRHLTMTLRVVMAGLGSAIHGFDAIEEAGRGVPATSAGVTHEWPEPLRYGATRSNNTQLSSPLFWGANEACEPGIQMLVLTLFLDFASAAKHRRNDGMAYFLRPIGVRFSSEPDLIGVNCRKRPSSPHGSRSVQHSRSRFDFERCPLQGERLLHSRVRIFP